MKTRLATVWLGGCSGCHMSFLDLDERLIELAEKIDLVYSPLADFKTYPRNVDVALVEGAVNSLEHEEAARLIRRNSRYVISFGDCATTGNVTALRNRFTLDEVLRRTYADEPGTEGAPLPAFTIVDMLAPIARPLHEVIRVDAFLHGCPPTADEIWFAVTELLQGRIPVFKTAYLKFG